MNTPDNKEWDLVIKPSNKWYQIDLAAIWHYRDLLMLLVRRDFVAQYKQTILGPVWFLIQPILTAITFTLIFGGIAKLSTDGNPAILFYMAGITLWTYFADCLTKTSSTFVTNANVFGKVYFPRLIVPLSVLVSSLIKLGVQFLIFMTIWIYYYSTTDKVHPHGEMLWLFPLLVLIMAGLGFGFGILISSLTTKYRDLTFLITFGVQLLMYASSVVIPVSGMSEKTRNILLLNPLTSVIEGFKYVFLGSGFYEFGWVIYSLIFTIVLIFVSIVVFSKVEKSFMDTV